MDENALFSSTRAYIENVSLRGALYSTGLQIRRPEHGRRSFADR